MKTDKLAIATLLAGAVLALNITGVSAQSGSEHQMHGAHGMDQMEHAAKPAAKPNAGIATLPGQDAFGAIQEIITILEADPATDWSRVDIAALRAHLVDMNRLVMDTDVRIKIIDGGLEMHVTGQGGALRAIHSMVPAHAPMIDGVNGWVARAAKTATGASLRVTSVDPKEVAHIRGLGFYGLMATGSHHQTHHLGLARGETVHSQ
ncbi:MAG: hypothetical protein HQ514_14405 [Rhodospirillales bacterium]|nr:hypothetical protein [Rhodospirillales bacterium]